MQVLTPGHRYALQNFENKDQAGHIIQFIEKEPDPYGSDKLITIHDGTTNEEVLKMLIDRLKFLYNKFPSEETESSIEHCQQALYAQQSRTYDRQQRGVDGQHKA